MKKLQWFTEGDLIPDDAKYLRSEMRPRPNVRGTPFAALFMIESHLYEIQVTKPAELTIPNDGTGYINKGCQNEDQ